jgi:amino acid transporter
MGIIVLAKETGAKVADSVDQLGGAPEGYHPKTLIAQLADAVFHDFPIGLYLIAGVTALILVLAANTAFNGFPVLGSILAQDRYLPRQLSTRGDRLAFSNGILFLAFAAIAFVVAFRAEVTALIQLYIVGVFVSFTLSQIGMVRRDRRRRAAQHAPGQNHQHHRLHLHGCGASRGHRDEIPCRGLDCDHRDGISVRGHEDDPQALRDRRP